PADPRAGTNPTPGPAHSGLPRPVWDPQRPLSVEVLGWNLEHWLAQLRPDPRHGFTPSPLNAHVNPYAHRGPNTRVWVSLHEPAKPGVVEGDDKRIDLWAGHPLAIRVIAAPTPGNLAWLLLATYAHINAAASLVTCVLRACASNASNALGVVRVLCSRI